MSENKVRDRLEEIPKWKKRWFQKLTRISFAVRRLMIENDMDEADLAGEIERSEEFVHRFLGGGINLKMNTIAQIEAVFETDLFEVNEDLLESKSDRKRRNSS